MTSYNVLFWDLAMRCLFQWRSFTPDEIPPASSECLQTIVAFCLHLGGGGRRCSYFCWGAKAPEFIFLVISELPLWNRKDVKQAARGYIQEFLFWTRLLSPMHKTFEDLAFAALPVLSPLSYLPMVQLYGNSSPFTEYSILVGSFGPLHTCSLGQFTWGNMWPSFNTQVKSHPLGGAQQRLVSSTSHHPQVELLCFLRFYLHLCCSVYDTILQLLFS